MQTMRRLTVPWFLLAAASGQSTWVVAPTPGPGVHFTSLPLAVASAASGDTLLVQPGSYAPFQVTGKALSIVGSGSGVTRIENAPTSVPSYVRIASPPAGSTFRMSGLRIHRDLSGAVVHLLSIVHSGAGAAGAVALHDVVCEPVGVAVPAPGIGLRVSGIEVHASRCTFRGGWSSSLTAIGDDAVQVGSGGLLVADASVMQGGQPPLLVNNNSFGGRGLSAEAGQVHLTRCTVRGGAAAVANTVYAAMGGDGIVVAGAAVVRVAGSFVDTIAGGQASGGVPSQGGDGIQCTAGQVSVYGAVTLAGGAGSPVGLPTNGATIVIGLPARPSLTITGVAAAGGDLLASQPVTASVRGAPGALGVLLVDVSPGYAALPGLSGEPLLVGPQAFIQTVGVLDAAGNFASVFVPTLLGPGWVDIATHWQAFTWQPGLTLWSGTNFELRRFRP